VHAADRKHHASRLACGREKRWLGGGSRGCGWVAVYGSGSVYVVYVRHVRPQINASIVLSLPVYL